MINRNKIATGSLAALVLFAVSAPAFAGFYELAPSKDVDICVAEIQNSATEETTVELLPLAALPDALRSGGIDHALVVAALYAFELWRSGSD